MSCWGPRLTARRKGSEKAERQRYIRRVDAGDGRSGEGGHARVLLLGPIAVQRGRSVVAVRGTQQAVVLSLLALHPGRALASEQLIERAWGGQPPASAAAALRVHLARIRSLLSSGGVNPLRHTGRGYVLEPDLVDTDVQQVEALVRAARQGDDQAALQCVEQALAVWRGQPFSGVRDDEGLQIEAARLSELQMELQEDGLDLRLALGQHIAVCGAASVMVAEQPLRERRTRQLMLALYRSGRQSEALAAYGRLRDRLVEQLAVEPAPETRLLEGRILRQEVSLEPPHRDPPLAEQWEAREREVLGREPGTVPRSSAMIRGLVAERLGTLTAEGVVLVRLVALLGDLSVPGVLAEALRVDLRRVNGLALHAQRAGLLVAEEAPAGGVLSLRRGLRDAVLAGSTAEELPPLHRAAAAAIEANLPDTGPARVAAAWHRIAAGVDPGDAEWGSPVLRALDACLQEARAELAQALASRAREISGVAPETRVDLAVRLVRALSMQGEVEQAEEVWRRGVESARELDDAERLALMVLSRDWEQRSLMSDASDQGLLTEALEKLGPRPSALRVRVASALLLEMVVPGRNEDLGELAHDVQAAARELGDVESFRSASYARHVQLRASPDVDQRLKISHDLWAATHDCSDPWWRARALVARIFDEFVAGAHQRVPTLALELRACAEESRSPRLSWHHALVCASVSRDRGDFTEADGWSDEAMVQGAASGIPDALAAGALHQLLVSFHRSSLAGLLPTLRTFADLQPENVLVPAALALAHAQDEDPVSCREAALAFMRKLERTASSDELVPLALGMLAESQSIVGSAEFVADLASGLAPFSGQFITFGQVSATFGPVDRVLALVRTLEGELDGALELLARAQRASADAPALSWQVRCGADLARLLAIRGDASGARVEAHTHLALARQLGLQPAVAELLRHA